MYGYEQHQSLYSSDHPNNMIQFQISHPPPDNRPKTTHISSSLTRNFPLHKSGFYKNYKYNIISSNNRVKPLQKPTTQSTPNFNNVANSNYRDQIIFPMWSKPFRPKLNNKAISNGLKKPSTVLRTTNVTNSSNYMQSPTKINATQNTRNSVLQSRPQSRMIKEDLPPISRQEKKETDGTPPPIRVTFKYKDRAGGQGSAHALKKHPSSSDLTGGEREPAVPESNMTMQRYVEYIRREGHTDLTHNSFTKVEMWLAGLEEDGTWPVLWFQTKHLHKRSMTKIA